MKLADYLDAHGLTASAFAGKIGRSIATVSRIARGLHSPDWPTMRAIAEATSGAVQPNDFYDAPAAEPRQPPAPEESPAAA